MSSVPECLSDLHTRAQSIAQLSNRVTTVHTPEELVRLIKGISIPAVGVVYEGMKALEEVGNTGRGLGSTAMFGLYLAVDATQLTKSIDQTPSALTLLSALRATLFDKKSPSGHYWKFVSEGYAESFPNRSLWIQRWTTKLPVPA